RKQCQVRLALATEHGQVDLDAADATRLGKRDRLGLDRLRGEDPAAARLRRVLADESEVARQLLDRVDRPDALDLDRDPLAGGVLHEDGSVRLEDEKPDRLGKNGAQTAGIADLAAGDEQAHTGNLLSVPDRSRSAAAGPAGWVARLTTNCRECGRRRRLQTG